MLTAVVRPVDAIDGDPTVLAASPSGAEIVKQH